MKRTILLLVLGLAACDGSRDVAVRVVIPGPDSVEAPAAGVGVIALPYDRDSVRVALEQRARVPKPNTAPLDTLFAEFRGPFVEFATASLAAGRLRDTVSALERARDSLVAGASTDRDALARRLDEARARLTAAEARRDSGQLRLAEARRRFGERGDSLRAAVRLWEDSTYQGYDSIVQGLVQRSGRTAATDTTGDDGWAHLKLKGGPWWIYVQAWDVTDPNAAWYWNVPLAGDTVLLNRRTGRRRPRY